jgi:hypothetical protein
MSSTRKGLALLQARDAAHARDLLGLGSAALLEESEITVDILGASTELTIVNGAITVTGHHHRVDTEADASSDILDTINGGSAGDLLLIRPEDAARTVELQEGGNLQLFADCSLDETTVSIVLVYNGTDWQEVSRSTTPTSFRNALGLGTIATQDSNSVNITGGVVSGITDLTVLDGGTGASDAPTARTNLGLAGMAIQEANSVAIVGGSITGLTAFNIGGDVVLARDAANILAQRNGANAQATRIYNTFTDASNYERGILAWVTNEFVVGTAVAGSGTPRDMKLVAPRIILDGAVVYNSANATISGDAITYSATRMFIDTEGGAPTDNLQTINTGVATGGEMLILRTANDARDVIVKDGLDNIFLNEGDCLLSDKASALYLLWSGLVWREVSRSTKPPERRASLGLATRTIQFQFDDAVPVSIGDDLAYVSRIPSSLNGGIITAVHAQVKTAGSGGLSSWQLVKTGAGTGAVNVLSTELSIDTDETSSDTAATPPVINTANDDLVTGDRLSLKGTAVGTTPAKGLTVTVTITL